MDGQKIISLLWARAESAIEALAVAYGNRLRQTAMNILGSSQDAEECVNDTYLAVWNAIPPRRPDSLAGFVYRVGRNISLKRLRSNGAQKRSSGADLSLEELAGCIPGPAMEETLDERELGRAIDRFLDTQSRENRAIFLRRYWFGDAVGQIAADLGLTENTVSARLSRIRQKLKTYLLEEGLFHV